MPIGRSGSLSPARERRSAFDDGLDRLVLADDAPVQALLHVDELLDLALHEPADGDARPAWPTTSAMSSASTSSLRKPASLPSVRLLGLGAAAARARGSCRSAARPRAARSASRSARSSLALRLGRAARLIAATPSIASFSACHCARHLGRALAQLGELALDRLAARRRDASSLSFSSDVSSISSCMMRRSTSSISVGTESISMRRREADSSMRSIALSGRKRSVM